MGPNTKELYEIWWPAPDAFQDLSVEDSEEGFTLSAPDDSECAAWLNYYNQTEELREKFNQAFTQVLTDYLNQLTEQNGSPLEDSLGNEDARSGQTEEDSAGSV